MQIKQKAAYSSLESKGDILAGCIYLGVVSIYGVIKAKETSHKESEFKKERGLRAESMRCVGFTNIVDFLKFLKTKLVFFFIKLPQKFKGM